MEARTGAVESWRDVWRRGFAPLLPADGLAALAEALRTDDPRLRQGSTTVPPPLRCVHDWPCEAGCALAFVGAVANGGFGAASVGAVNEFFAQVCFDADQRLGAPAACRWFLNWFDETPRDEMRRDLLSAVLLALEPRTQGAA